MKIPIKLNGITVEKTIPVDYGSLSFELWTKLVQEPDPIKRFIMVVDVDPLILRKAEIKNLDKVFTILSFLNKPLNPFLPYEIGPIGGLKYKVPKNLEFVETGRYMDISETLKPITKESTAQDLWKLYPELCAITSMPDYTQATMEAQQEFIKQFWQAPCEEVVAIGNFTVLKFSELNLNIQKSTPKHNTLPRRLLLAFRIWLANTVFSLRYASWKKKHLTGGMSY